MKMTEYIREWLHEHGDLIMNTFIGFMVGLLIAACLVGCKTKIVTVTEYRDRQIHDTTQVVDSVYRDRWHVELQKGDTIILRDSVFVYKYKYLDKIKETYIHDSIPYAVEVVTEVPRKRSGYDRFCSVFFWVFVVIMLIFIAFKICDKIPACKPYTTAIKAFLKLRI